jgi:DNA-binding HxlR family transcriptional regulator
MVTTIPAKIDTLQVIRSLHDDKSLTIFRRVVDGVELEKLDEGMTRKQFYSRLSNLKKSHLITRKEVKIKKGHGQYEPTSLGLVIHRALQLIDKGTSLGWALNAYDAVIHQQKDVSVEDKRRVLDSLVADH